MIIEKIKEDQFESKVLNSDGIVFVRFFGSWCGPCKMQSQILARFDDPNYSDLTIFELDTDKCEKLNHQFNITTVPTLIVFKDGAELEKYAGFRNKAQLTEIFNSFIDLEK